jgi:hypothetical protein
VLDASHVLHSVGSHEALHEGGWLWVHARIIHMQDHEGVSQYICSYLGYDREVVSFIHSYSESCHAHQRILVSSTGVEGNPQLLHSEGGCERALCVGGDSAFERWHDEVHSEG